MATTTRADGILQEVYQDLTIDHLSPIEKYLELDRIVEKLHELHNRTPINIGTTGTISERLCQLAISPSQHLKEILVDTTQTGNG